MVVMSVKMDLIDLCQSRPRHTSMISFSHRVEDRRDRYSGSSKVRV
jgi:hypothetical protein